MTIVERIMARVQVNPDTGCWIWTGAQAGDGAKAGLGYGKIGVAENGTTNYPYTHRVMYEHAHGPIPDGLLVCHTCDTPPCVNPDHLFLGTDKTNSDDKISKHREARGERHGSRTHPERWARGERTGHAKVTEDQVREIRRRSDELGESTYALANAYGISRRGIRKILNRESWAHVREVELRPGDAAAIPDAKVIA